MTLFRVTLYVTFFPATFFPTFIRSLNVGQWQDRRSMAFTLNGDFSIDRRSFHCPAILPHNPVYLAKDSCGVSCIDFNLDLLLGFPKMSCTKNAELCETDYLFCISLLWQEHRRPAQK